MGTCLLRLALIASVVAVPPLAEAQTAPPARPLIVMGIDDAALATLAGNTRPEIAVAVDEGAVADDLPLEHVLLQLRRPADREKAFERYLDGLTDPGARNYQHWLTAEQIGALYGPARRDLDAVTGWLRSHGFTVNTVYSSGMVIDFTGTAGQVATAFHTEIHSLVADGVRHIANMGDPQIPAALAPLVVGPVSLNDFFPHPQSRLGPGFTVSGCTAGDPSNVSSVCRLVAPADLATIYNFTPVFSAGNGGQGQTIALVENGNIYSTDDWHQFRATFNLNGIGAPTLQVTHPAPPHGHNNCTNPGINSAEGEATLDMEYASAAAPGADLIMASCKDTTTTSGVLIAIQNLIHAERTPTIISESYGDCEAAIGDAGNAAFRTAYQTAAGEGISVFVSAGDPGAADCDFSRKFAKFGISVNGFASTPYNVAVGGTDFSDVYHGTTSTYWNSTNSAVDGSAKSYVPEIPWNNSCANELLAKFVTGSNLIYGASGFCNSHDGKTNFLTTFAGSGAPSSCATHDSHGDCQGYVKPAWQQGTPGNPHDGVRDLPDVALFAAGIPWGHAYLWCLSDPAQNGFPCSQTSTSQFFWGDGTSFAAPVMAGIQALINRHAGGRQGNPNPKLYKIAKQQYSGGGNACNATLGARVSSKCSFRDITEGDSAVPCQKNSPDCYFTGGTYGVISTSTSAYEPAYRAHVGWDFTTGVGSVNVATLVNNWP